MKSITMLYSLLVPLFAFAPLGIVEEKPEMSTEKVSVQYGHKRPFSFYYPYDYKFYYPRPQYKNRSNSCYWVYTNGTYVYTCN